MKRNYREAVRASSSDHTMATVARVLFGVAGVLAGMMIIRSLPDLMRYVKMERM
jgi:hypothetical protein